jgi:hypothetical protein
MVALGSAKVGGVYIFYPPVIFSFIAIFTRNEIFHGAFAVTSLSYLFVNGFVTYEFVG